ncbi:hypothetical protein FJU08_18815 [Martelella alba]|uniref:Uncharacterized protein n=1 Tax=Martelella alba TaxID=2590451 RepID=A0A506U4U9_9HYPH|nr:hypothetical protein FJU08_18815 [Martelella alba]
MPASRATNRQAIKPHPLKTSECLFTAGAITSTGCLVIGIFPTLAPMFPMFTPMTQGSLNLRPPLLEAASKRKNKLLERTKKPGIAGPFR